MKTSVNSIYHLRMIKPPKIKFNILLFLIVMALIFSINNQEYIITYEDEIIIKDNEFIIAKELEEPIYLNNQKVTLVSKENKKGFVIYRIADFKDGPAKIRYQKRMSIFKLLKNL